MGRAGPRLALIALIALAALVPGARCAEPAFEFNVTFPDAQGLRSGSDVLYAGVRVGEVLGLSIEQPDPRSPGRARVRVALDDPELRVRRGDRVRVGREGWLSRARLEIEPRAEAAEPLAPGETLAGEPEPSLDAWASRVSEYVRSVVGETPEPESP
jgi:ABC-type transporter Mla subunit MlaD